MAQTNPNVYAHLRSGHSKRFEKPSFQFEHTSSLLHGKAESVQVSPNGIAYVVIGEFADKVSLMETRLRSPKARKNFEKSLA